MEPLAVDGRLLARDKDGYLKSLADWDDAVAGALAAAEGIALDAQHRAVIAVARDFYREHRVAPANRVLVKAVARALGPELGNSSLLARLFASSRHPQQGPALVIARIAGLPRPTNCL